MLKNFFSIIVGMFVCLPLCAIAVENSKDAINKFCKSEMNEKHLLFCKMKNGVVLESGTSLAWILSNTDKDRMNKTSKRNVFTKGFGIDFSVYSVTFKNHLMPIRVNGKIISVPSIYAYFAVQNETIDSENYYHYPLLGIMMFIEASEKVVVEKMMQRYPKLRTAKRKINDNLSFTILENDDIKIELNQLVRKFNGTRVIMIDKKIADKFAKLKSEKSNSDETVGITNAMPIENGKIVETGALEGGIKLLKMKDGTILRSGKSYAEIKKAYDEFYVDKKLFDVDIYDYSYDPLMHMECIWFCAHDRKSGVSWIFACPFDESRIPTEADLRMRYSKYCRNFWFHGKSILLRSDIDNNALMKCAVVGIIFYKDFLIPFEDILEKYQQEIPNAVTRKTYRPVGQHGRINHIIENDAQRVTLTFNRWHGRTMICIIDKKIEQHFGRALLSQFEKEWERQNAIQKDEEIKEKQRKLDF